MNDDLISRSRALAIMRNQWTLHGAMNAVANMPSVDAVEVVRCKDCKHLQRDTIFGVSYCGGKRVTGDWYCADGERRADDGS